MTDKALERDYSKFYTRPETAALMVGMAETEPFMTILEPHAGSGAIIRAVRELEGDGVIIHAVEIQPTCYNELLSCVVDIIVIGNFLHLPMKDNFYDRVIANPPFGNETNLGAHFIKMYNVLRPGGILVLILPGDFIVPEYLAGEILERLPLENWGTNKDGTVTPIQILKFKKSRNP